MPNQYFATNRKVGDGSTTVWEFSFAGARPDANNGTEPYLESEDVGVALVSYDAEGREQRTPVSFTLLGPSQVEVVPAIADGQDFVIYRETESGLPASDFTDFASISEQDLDNAMRQVLFVVQEARDDLEDGNENAATARGIANSAAAEAASATATANSATATANTALSTANSASTAAANAVSVANSSAADASTALSTANQALGEAEDATLAVAGAISTADSAATAAAQAVSTANTANSTASSANTTANSALATANTAASDAATALSTANAATVTANAADDKADTALFEANQAQEAASLIVGFQEQLDTLAAQVADLTGVEPGSIALNSENLSGLADFAAARTNLDVYSKGETDTAISTAIAPINTRLTTAEGEIDTLQTNVSAAQTNITGLQANKADKSLILTAGDGLTGGGDLSANRSLAVDATVVRTSRSVTAGNGLTGGGTLATDQTLTLGTPGTLSGTTSNGVTAGSHTHEISSTTSRTSTSTSLLLAAAAMNSHRTSGDHDGRYYTQTQIDERVLLDSGFRKTPTSSQVYFQIYKSSAQMINAVDTKITFTQLQSGRDNPSTPWYYPLAWWDTTNHRFVAPVGGVYYFYAQVYRILGATSAADIRFGINGTILKTTGPQGFAPGQGDANVNTYFHARIEMYQYLNAGDYVEVFCTSEPVEIAGSTTGRLTHFGGHLL